MAGLGLLASRRFPRRLRGRLAQAEQRGLTWWNAVDLECESFGKPVAAKPMRGVNGHHIEWGRARDDDPALDERRGRRRGAAEQLHPDVRSVDLHAPIGGELRLE